MTQPNRNMGTTRWRRRAIASLTVIALLVVISLAGTSLMSTPPENSGPIDGQLRGCPQSPNCVSSQSKDAEHYIEPFEFVGTAEDALARLKRVVEQMPRAVVVSTDELYLHAEFTTLVFRFVDDVEFLIDPAAKQIQVRSASRTGHSDFGKNRSRMEQIRAAWMAAPEQ